MDPKTQIQKEHLSGKEISLPPPMSLTATSGDMEGEIDLIWEPVNGANSYVVQKSTGPQKPDKWAYQDIVTKSMYTVSKLKSKHSYWFRVAAVGSRGQSQWSEPVRKKAP